jgi:hypothetical protein
MTVTALGASSLAISRTEDVLSAWLSQPGVSGADPRGAVPGHPAGPWLSAVDMAVACLFLADAIWDADATRPVARPVS